ncbi:MAG: protein translocase subunit SecF [Fretibacterium sp.]|uniref:protein translocase subunit SecF n=1 Tax=Fretibacterium sp. OH1220_COT-178 TaxID=2491047 RepID=UPI000F5EB260|nr:protein translocase subunit SecF [Fretibacterium sp. OH1220_COT-178]MDO4785672.1 protein translocase subunit SecF [Fretibacterium sp.]RRD65289.1 protein translocase subunit SecF [Fretibacterium sp. OH1220_COT-178]
MGFNINFMGYRRPALVLSLVLCVISVGLLLFKGLNLGIDFTGGNVIQVEFENRPDVASVREVVSAVVAKGAMIQNFGEKGIIIRTNEDTEQSREQVLKVLNDKYADMKVIGFEKVGPVVGRELRNQAVVGISIALVAILIYITVRFQFRFAVVSVVPLVHDVLIALGFFSLTQMEIASSFIAALLTIVGYSLNNTIIILDRIRENWRSLPKDGIVDLVNRSVNQTFSRTINTTLTTLFPVIALCVWGGPVLQAFSYAMLVGIVAGTYSSIFVATGSLVEWWLCKPE